MNISSNVKASTYITVFLSVVTIILFMSQYGAEVTFTLTSYCILKPYKPAVHNKKRLPIQTLKAINITHIGENLNLDLKLAELFPKNQKQPFEEEMNLISVEERQMMRLQTIRKFCKSDLYRDMGYNSEALEDTHLSKKVTLFRKFGAFECRVAKTGEYITIISVLRNFL